MNRGCLALAGLGLLSLLAFGVTLEAINDPEQLTAIPFTPWDFLTYSILALAILTLIRFVRRYDPHRTLPGKWTSHVKHNGTRFRTTLRLDADGNAEIYTKEKAGDPKQNPGTSARWQLLDDKTLHLWGTQTVTWKILKLNNWSMITARPAGSGSPVRWIKHPKSSAKACLLVTAAVLLPVLFALSLPRFEPSHVIADDPQYIPSDALGRGH
jgi:hypothetical protein